MQRQGTRRLLRPNATPTHPSLPHAPPPSGWASGGVGPKPSTSEWERRAGCGAGQGRLRPVSQSPRKRTPPPLTRPSTSFSSSQTLFITQAGITVTKVRGSDGRWLGLFSVVRGALRLAQEKPRGPTKNAHFISLTRLSPSLLPPTPSSPTSWRRCSTRPSRRRCSRTCRRYGGREREKGGGWGLALSSSCPRPPIAPLALPLTSLPLLSLLPLFHCAEGQRVRDLQDHHHPQGKEEERDTKIEWREKGERERRAPTIHPPLLTCFFHLSRPLFIFSYLFTGHPGLPPDRAGPDREGGHHEAGRGAAQGAAGAAPREEAGERECGWRGGGGGGGGGGD